MDNYVCEPWAYVLNELLLINYYYDQGVILVIIYQL